MGETGTVVDRRGAGRRAARILLVVAAAIGLAYMLLIALVLAVIKCGDTCGGADTEHWRWSAQLVLAVAGAVLAAAALVLGFTSRTRAARTLVLWSAACVLAWLIWVPGLGDF